MIRFRILFDFHRTTADIGLPIQRLAKKWFNVRIPITETCRRLIVGRYLDEKQYDQILQKVIENPAYACRHVQEVTGAIHAMTELKADGHAVEIVTASQTKGHIAVLRWLEARQAPFYTRSVGRRVRKGGIARDYDIALEDSPNQAESLAQNGTPFVYLLDRPTNRDLETPSGVTRIPSHLHFLQEVRLLYRRLFPQEP